MFIVLYLLYACVEVIVTVLVTGRERETDYRYRTDGILGPDVPGLQQTYLLELDVSVNHLGTSPVNGMVMGSRMFHQGRQGQVSTSPCSFSLQLSILPVWPMYTFGQSAHGTS